jgi:hypothetical protein
LALELEGGRSRAMRERLTIDKEQLFLGSFNARGGYLLVALWRGWKLKERGSMVNPLREGSVAESGQVHPQRKKQEQARNGMMTGAQKARIAELRYRTGQYSTRYLDAFDLRKADGLLVRLFCICMRRHVWQLQIG